MVPFGWQDFPSPCVLMHPHILLDAQEHQQLYELGDWIIQNWRDFVDVDTILSPYFCYHCANGLPNHYAMTRIRFGDTWRNVVFYVWADETVFNLEVATGIATAG